MCTYSMWLRPLSLHPPPHFPSSSPLRRSRLSHIISVKTFDAKKGGKEKRIVAKRGSEGRRWLRPLGGYHHHSFHYAVSSRSPSLSFSSILIPGKEGSSEPKRRAEEEEEEEEERGECRYPLELQIQLRFSHSTEIPLPSLPPFFFRPISPSDLSTRPSVFPIFWPHPSRIKPLADFPMCDGHFESQLSSIHRRRRREGKKGK